MSAHVSLSKLKKIFKDSHTGREIVAVSNFSLDIQKSEMVTLLGPSGCGKTTVLRMLGGFETPTSGDILLNGERINHLPPNKRNSSMVFQSYALFPHMNVEQNITYGLKVRGVDSSTTQQKLKKTIQVVGLSGFEKRRPNELSGGQQQRVALARALIVEPQILLFDEPLSNLDAKLRESMRSEIRRIQKELSITSIYVTHDQMEAMAISDRVVVMNEGKIEQIGKPSDIYLKPKSLFVADFMGAANFVKAKVITIKNNIAEVQFHHHRYRVSFEAQNLKPNDTVTLVLRPESIHETKAQNGIEGIIRDYHYLGSENEYRLELVSGEIIKARMPATLTSKPRQPGDSLKFDIEENTIHMIV